MSVTRRVIAHDQAAARPATRPAARTQIWVGLLALALALLAFALRVWTVRQSLPYVDHPDEPNPVGYVVRMLQTGDPNQGAFQKPSLYVYLLLAVLSLHYQLGLAAGNYPPIAQLVVATHTVTSIPEFFFWGRVLTAVIGGLTVLTAYAVVQRAWSRPAALVGALFVALAPFHVRFSRYITTDVASAWLVLLCFGACVPLLRTGSWRAYLVAGAFAGLAASTKYNAGLAALMVLAAHLLFWRRAALRQVLRLLAAALAALGAFFAVSPYLLLRWQDALGDVVGQWYAYRGAHEGYFHGTWNVVGYVEFLWGDGLRPAAALATLAGIAILLRKQPTLGLLWLSFALPTLLLHMAMQTHFMQNMLPLVVLCALPIGVALEAVVAAISRFAPRLRPVIVVLLLVVLLLPGMLETARVTAQQVRGDTRVQAIAWLDTHVPPGSRIAAEIKPLPHSVESRWTDVPTLLMYDLAWYRSQGYAYLVTSSKRWGQLATPPEYAALLPATPLAEFGSSDAEYMLGPRVLIYATGLAATDVPEQLPEQVHIGGARFLGITIGRAEINGMEPVRALEPTRRFKPGELLGLRTFWQVEQPYDADYFIFVHLFDAQGNRVTQRDAPPWQGRYPTTTWQPGSLVADVNDLPLPANLPPGEYTLMVGMFNPTNSTHPTITVNGEQRPIGSISVGTITIEE